MMSDAVLSLERRVAILALSHEIDSIASGRSGSQYGISFSQSNIMLKLLGSLRLFLLLLFLLLFLLPLLIFLASAQFVCIL
jgi:hypothetical protein